MTIPLFCIPFLILAIVYILCVLFLLKGLLSLKKEVNGNECTFSVVIAARNEEKCIGKCLESILSQSISSRRYEIIVIDDRSTDATQKIISDYSSRYHNIKTISILETPSGLSPKKFAIQKGIEIAENEIIVFTDADCSVGKDWLETIDHYFTKDTGLVQGITTYNRPDGMNRFFFGLQAVDFLSHGIVAAAGIGAGMPINSNANNFAFRKAVFESINGYGEAGKVVSGDDDLLLQRVWKNRELKVRFMTDVSGAVSTRPTETVRGVFEQRKRWGSKTVHYNIVQVCFLGGIFLFYLSVLSAFCAGLFFQKYLILFASIAVVKLSGEMLLLMPGTRLFNKKELRRFIIPASLFQTAVVVYAVTTGVFGKFKWKGQRFSRTIQ